MNPIGGTEILLSGLLKHIDPTVYGVNIIIGGSHQVFPNQPKAVNWEHRNIEQQATRILRDKKFTDKIAASVFVSNWQLENFRRTYFDLPMPKSVVIRNAIEPIEYLKKPKGKLKLIYTSTPWRGLDLLLNVFEQLDRDDVELDVYSSTIIYGTEFFEKNNSAFEKTFDRAKTMKNVNYLGYANNDDIKKAMQESHIFAYPSVFEETSCLGLIEAGAAGCSLATTNLGALPETACGWARMSPMQYTEELLIKRYKTTLSNAIDNYWFEEQSGKFEKQSDFFNDHYSWSAVVPEWKRLFEAVM
jgi:glycosyltransferase involved in cell wall biosynthesis